VKEGASQQRGQLRKGDDPLTELAQARKDPSAPG
jgi:hypothetical protein